MPPRPGRPPFPAIPTAPEKTAEKAISPKETQRPKEAPMEPQSVSITTEYIKLEALLKLANLVSSGGEAKCLIQDGQVSVNGQVCRMRGKKLRPGDRVAFAGRELTVQ